MRISTLTILRRGAPRVPRGPFTKAIGCISWSQLRLCGSCTLPNTPTVSTGGNLPPDHRTIAASQDLLITHSASPGSPLFMPHGAHIFNKLQSFIRAQYVKYGYEEVITPTIYKKSLWETSGHWDIYKEDMFEVTGRGQSEVRDEDVEKEEYGLKPMNCPGHCLLFKHRSGSMSLRDLPVRYADFAPLHRNERSGSLSGLTRVRRFHQDDAHIFCRPIQIAQEISSTLRFIDTVYKVFQLPSYKLVLSTRPSKHIGSREEWDRAEEALKNSLNTSGQEWSLNEGDGAFYGPKIDILVTDSDGKQHQTATIQLDFQLPRRFELTYMAPAPESEQRGVVSSDPKELKESGLVTPVIIHRAILGSFERFMALLMEHYDGKWPFWLSPRQAIVIPVAMTDEMLAYARAVKGRISGVLGPEDQKDKDGDTNRPLPMSRRTFSVDIDESSNSLSKKVRAAKTKRYNYIIVVGEKNMEAGTVSVDTTVLLPVAEDSPQDQKQSGDQSRGAKRAKREMTVGEVYECFLELENEYA